MKLYFTVKIFTHAYISMLSPETEISACYFGTKLFVPAQILKLVIRVTAE